MPSQQSKAQQKARVGRRIERGADKTVTRPPWYDRHGWMSVFRFGEIVAFIAVAVSLVFFWIDWSDRVEQRRVNEATLAEIREARQYRVEVGTPLAEETLKEIQAAREARADEAIARAWSILGIIAPGNSGKREALQTLNAAGVDLDGIDLSCARMGGGWDDEKITCERRVYLREASLSGANLRSADLSGANLWEVDLSGARLWGADFTDVNLLDTAHFSNAWAWDDGMPVGLGGLGGITIDICPMELRDQEPHIYDKPASGCAPMVME